VLTAELTLLQEYELAELKQASTVLFLVHDPRVQGDLAREKEKKEGGRKTRCLRVLATYLQLKSVPGGTRLRDASDVELNKGVLRFKSPHQSSKEGTPWAWELVLTSTCVRSMVTSNRTEGVLESQRSAPPSALAPWL
jgi:hypothetical protein